ncbi:hypothetical protein A3C17_04550 [Candidatus Uhrbacteria bacterium RIFCSPHIGHO2_02_FULL_53_13]|uniref:SbsA Ig-like domain-containing protein n=2 Tax=Candidatus Uhriibacteriota TaxID=1752732 RepID=A0A1F7U2Y7_9BACT|nr:MAG: hypothetical protein A3C17_04550 [Candidatus Uhrbacteria bacterium RIFCSPHIGHO2_02_FULL_53_13]
MASTRFTWTSSSGANGFGGSLSGNASASGTDITITIGSAEADETGYSTIPTISYSDNSDDATNNIQDASGNIVQTFAAQNVSDSARPRAKTVTFYDASSSDGKLDLITVVFTENISAAANASADWALSSAANFSGISEGTVECNSGSAGANECDYNFTTTTVKTNVGDLSLAYTAGSSLTDGTNTANSLTLTSSSTPAFTDAVAPAAINALISIAGATGTGGAFKISDTVTVTWDNSSTAGDVSSVTANLSQFGGGASATMTDTTACGGTASNNIYEACYTILGSEAIDDANNNVSVTATDAASNSRTGTDTTDATVDTIVPTVSAANISVTGASGTSGAFKNGDTAVPTWNNTASGDNNSDTISSVSVSAANFRSGDTALSATNASGTWTASLSGAMDSQDDANNNVSITATDNAGNTTTTAGTNNYTLDTIVPTLTNTNITVTGCTGTSGACKNGDTGVARWDNSVTGDNNSDTIASATFNASALDDGSSSLSGSVLSGIYSATIGTLDSQDDTGNTITATIVDNAGNSTGPTTSSASYTVDTIAPTVTAGKISVTGGSGTSGAFKNGDTGTARWDNSATGDNNSDTLASVTMNASAFDDGSSALSGSVTSGIYTATVGALDSQDDTSNNITVTAVDNAGNSTATAGTNNYTVDTIVPTVTQASVTVAGATGTSGAFKNGNSPVLTWNPTTSGESDTIASASFDGSSFKSGDTALSGSLATNWTASLSGAMDLQDDTSNAVTVTVVDNVGNSTGPTTSSTTYTIDTVLPTISTAVYQDNNGNGTVDRVVLTFSEDVSSGFSADKDEWTFPTASELTLTAPTLDASVTNSTTTVTIAVGADANETGHTTAPTIAYTNTSGTLQDDAGNAVANVTAQTLTDDAGPLLLSSDPSDAEQNVSRNDAVTMTFSEPIVTASFAYTCCGTGTDPGSRAVTWSSNDTVATVAHAQFQSSNDITLTVTDAPDGASNTFVGAVAAAANPFTFTTAAAGGVVVGVNDTAGPTSGSTSNQTITLVSPNGGGTYTAGSSTPIAWTQRGRIDMVNVAYSLDNGATWTILASGIRNLGSYLWTLPDIVADRVRIRVQGTDLASVYTEDSSDSAFSIVKAPVASQTAPEPSLPPADNAVAVDTKTPIILELGEPVVEVDTPREEALKLAVGDVLRGVTDPAVYVIRSDGKRAVFPDSETYFSYFDSFDHVVTINDDQLRKLPLGKRVTVRPGTWLVKIQSDPRVYAVEDGGLLRHVPNEDTARFLYGDTWNSQVRDVNVAFFKDYRIGEPLPSNTYLPEGTVFSYEESPQLYVVQNRIRRLFLDAEAFALNHFQDRFVRNISLLFEFEDGEPIQGIDQDLLDALIRS